MSRDETALVGIGAGQQDTAVDCADARVAAATSVQGFPVTFSAGGKQYLAVSTGLGGGSPRLVPQTIAPDVHHPATGNALYVFELPDKK